MPARRPRHPPCHRVPKESSHNEVRHCQMSPSCFCKTASSAIFLLRYHRLHVRRLGLRQSRGILRPKLLSNHPNSLNQTTRILPRSHTTCGLLCAYLICFPRVLISTIRFVQNALKYYSRPSNGSLTRQRRREMAISPSRRRLEGKEKGKGKA